MTKDYAPPSTTRRGSKSASAGRGKSSTASKSKTKSKTNSRSPNKPSNQGTPPNKTKLIAILVLLASGFIFGLYSLQKLPETSVAVPEDASENKKQSAPAEQVEPDTSDTASEKRFKFYDILPESEVIPPKDSPYTFKEKGAKKSYHYLVQTGSFRSAEDAERQKATIAFQGLKAKITAVENDQGTTWYRVSTGPFKSRSKMNSALDKLVNIGIEPLVKKIKED